MVLFELPELLMTASIRFILLALALPAAAFAQGNRGMDVRDLVNFDRLSSPVLSADGARVVYVVRQTDFEANRGFSHLVYRSEEHTSELQSLMRISYAVFCLQNKR